MCLILTENSKLKIADEDIVCYKVMRKPLIPGRIYRSEYYNYPYEVGNLEDVGCISIVTNDEDESIVKEGFHSFAYKEDAYTYDENRHRFDEVSYTVVECTIPKGATYIKGMFMGYSSYASNKIICKKEV